MKKNCVSLRELAEKETVFNLLQEDFCRMECGDESFFDLKFFLSEALTNAFVHGGSNTERPVLVNWIIRRGEIEISVADNGRGFVTEKADSLDSERFFREENGGGIYLVRQVMDKVWWNNSGNVIYGLKKI